MNAAAIERSIKVAAPLARRETQGRSITRIPANSTAALAPSLYAAHNPGGASAEGLRDLRSELILQWFDECRTFAVVGATKHEDADTVAANLAIVMAQLGEPTLLIDANLRQPRQHELFGLDPAFGVVDLLHYRDVYDQAVIAVPEVMNLHVLCAGRVPVNPQELVSRTSFVYLMRTLPDRFSAVIVATPPALEFADAQVIAARARGCLLVTRRHRTRIEEVRRIKSRLERAGAHLLGGIVQE